MRRYNIISAIFACTLLCCSCEHDFNLKDRGDEPRLYVNCVAGYFDTTFVNIQKCIPVNRNNEMEYIKTDISEIRMTVGGRDASVHKYKYGSDNLYNVYFTTERISPEDEIHLSVSEKECRAEASMRVPAVPVIEKIERTTTPMDGHYHTLKVDITIGGNVQDDSYYALDLISHEIHTSKIGNDEPFTEVYDTSVGISSISDGLSLTDDNEEIWIPCNFDRFGIEPFAYDPDAFTETGKHIYIFAGKDLLKNDRHIVFTATVQEDYEYVFTPVYYDNQGMAQEDETIYSSRISEYRIVLYALSPELYRYAHANYQIDNNILGILGLAPAMFSYSNISGGFGVLAGITSTTSEKFKVPITR